MGVSLNGKALIGGEVNGKKIISMHIGNQLYWQAFVSPLTESDWTIFLAPFLSATFQYGDGFIYNDFHSSLRFSYANWSSISIPVNSNFRFKWMVDRAIAAQNVQPSTSIGLNNTPVTTGSGANMLIGWLHEVLSQNKTILNQTVSNVNYSDTTLREYWIRRDNGVITIGYENTTVDTLPGVNNQELFVDIIAIRRHRIQGIKLLVI